MSGREAVQTIGGVHQMRASGSVHPLFRMAILKGPLSSIRLHILRGAPVNGRDGRGLTPLMLAAAAGRDDVCTLLLSEGADASITAPGDRTASDFAGAAGYSCLAESLAPPPVAVMTGSPAAGNRGPTLTADDERVATDGADGGWEPEEDFRPVLSDPAVIPAVRDVQTALATAKPHDTDPDWRDIRIDLPIPHRSSGTVDPGLMRMIAKAFASERVPASVALRLVRLNSGVKHLLEDLGVGIDATSFDEHVSAQIGRRAIADGDRDRISEAEEALEALLASASPEELFAAEVACIPHVDRSAEESMFGAFYVSRRMLFRQIAANAISVPGFLGPAEDVGATGDSPDMAFPDAPEGNKAGPFDPGTDAPASTLIDIILSLGDLVPLPDDRIFEGVEMNLGLACRLEEALRANGRLADAGRLASASGRYLRDRNRILEANLPLLFRIAPRYARGSVPAGDLIQEASIGLLRAIERFDASRGNRFAAYAVWWIRQACTRAIEDIGRTIRLPVYLADSMKRIESLRPRLSHQLGRAPLASELADAGGMRPDIVMRLEQLGGPVASLADAHIYGEVCDVAGEAEDAFESALSGQRRDFIAEAIATLAPRDAEVIWRRYGLDTGHEETLEEIGRDMGVTRERIRQIEARIIKQLAKSGSLSGRGLRALL